jgi:hypothetical protein
MSVSRILQSCMLLTVFITMLLPASADAQVPPRFYWKNLLGGHAVPVIFMDVSGNANPLDGSDFVIPDAQIDAKVALAGYAHTFSLFNRPAMWLHYCRWAEFQVKRPCSVRLLARIPMDSATRLLKLFLV